MEAPGIGLLCLRIPAKCQHPVSGQERSSSAPGAVVLFTPGHFATGLTLTEVQC